MLSEKSLLAVIPGLFKVAFGTEGPLCLGPMVKGQGRNSAYLPWRRTVVKDDSFRERIAIFQKLAVCTARRLGDMGLNKGQRGSCQSYSVLTAETRRSSRWCWAFCGTECQATLLKILVFVAARCLFPPNLWLMVPGNSSPSSSMHHSKLTAV